MNREYLEAQAEKFRETLEKDAPLLKFVERRAKFDNLAQVKEYEQSVIDVHQSEDRKAFIHSKKGLQIVILYMRVWNIDAAQACRELISDDAYLYYVCT